MGKKLDFLLRRNAKTWKLKTLASLSISRISILKKQRDIRCSHARSDVIQLLNLDQQERALLRVEHVIKEQNMLDVFAMIEYYCDLLTDRNVLFENKGECPEELKEAVSSLIFAASRSGEFPELQQIRKIFISKFGKEFVARAVELRNNCGVNPKMILKFSTRQASLESRLEVLKKIASENGIVLHLEDETSMITEEKQNMKQTRQELELTEATKANDPELVTGVRNFTEEMKGFEELSESAKSRKKYRNVAAAAQAAFESAADAATAARAAVELSRSESQDDDPNDHPGSNSNQQRTIIAYDGSKKYNLHIDGDTSSEDSKTVQDIEVESFSSEQESEKMEEKEWSETKSGDDKTVSDSSLDPDVNSSSIHDRNATLSREIIFNGSDNETEKHENNASQLQLYDSSSDRKTDLSVNEFEETREHNEVAEDKLSMITRHEKIVSG